jgi:colanic acid biosynthesis glycosyl transferase WcaI
LSAAFVARIGRRIGSFSWLHLQDFEVDAAFDLGLLSIKSLRGPMIAVERTILRSFDCVSTISPPMLERLAAKGVDKEKIHEIRNWTDTNQIAPGHANPRFRKEQLDLTNAHFICLYSGTISNKQGLELIIEAAKQLDYGGSNIRFVICGEGPHREKLQRLAAGLTNLQFLGLQAGESFTELLKVADVHLIPQRGEAADLVLPSKLGGILASGRPVIAMASPGTGLAEEVGKGGLVIPPGHVDELIKALRTLVQDPALCRSLGDNARKIALARWDRTTILRALNQTLEMISSRPLRSRIEQ